MSVKTIDSAMLAKMFLSGAKSLENKKDYINELNVFPVPDGDTGTNMTLTIMSAAKDVSALENPDMKSLCKSMSSGSLRGARGNSGVILSQLLRGFTKVAKEYDEIDAAIISAGFDKAVESAYKAVMKPKEGTILTVAKAAAVKANSLFEDGVEDLNEYFRGIIEAAKVSLDNTPELLPVLKEAGVVDSGGAGLLEILNGAYDAFCGKEIVFTMDDDTAKVAGETRKFETASGKIESDLKYIYATDIIFSTAAKTFNLQHESDYKRYLENIGENVTIDVKDFEVAVSLVTNDPGLVLQKALKYGPLTKVSVNNLKNEETPAQAPAKVEKKANEPKKPVGFIAVSVGAGIAEVFKNLGVDYLIEGGQTMNPSTEDMLNAIDQVNAETIFILPNNKNIVMAANQARDMTEDKRVIVIPTKTVPQGISAVISYVSDSSVEENQDSMLAEISLVKTGQVTYAVRDTVIDGCEIHQDDYMGIGDKGILSNGKDIEAVTLEMVDKMVEDDSEIITIYYGEDIKEDDANKIKALIEEKHGDLEVELQAGGQPIYYYIISVE